MGLNVGTKSARVSFLTLRLPQGPKRIERWFLLGDCYLETLWEAVKVPGPSPNFSSSLRGKWRPAARREKMFSSPWTPPRTLDVCVCVRAEREAASGLRSPTTEADLSARCDPSELAGLPRKVSFPAPRRRWGRFPPAGAPPAWQPGEPFHTRLPRAWGVRRVPRTRSGRGSGPRPESSKRNLAQGTTNFRGNLGPVAEPVSSLANERTHSVRSLSTLQLSDSEVDPASRFSPSPLLSSRTRLSAFFLGSGLLTHRGSPGLHAEPQSDGQQRLALHPAPRAGRSDHGSFSRGPPRKEGVDVERAPQRRTPGRVGRRCLGSRPGCRGVRGCE